MSPSAQILTYLYYCEGSMAKYLVDYSNYYSIKTNCLGDFRILSLLLRLIPKNMLYAMLFAVTFAFNKVENLKII